MTDRNMANKIAEMALQDRRISGWQTFRMWWWSVLKNEKWESLKAQVENGKTLLASYKTIVQSSV